MKSSNPAAAPRNTNANHPPLARNAQGHPVSMPDGAAWWGIKRQTRGRPKWIVGPDRRPYRLPLDATEEDIAETFGPGTYRLDALDDVGNVLDYVTTVEIAGDESDDDEGRGGSLGTRARGPSSDLRFALETILQMSRAQADALRAVSEAQADWVKGLASAKALPRNAPYLGPLALPPPNESNDDGEEDDDEAEDAAPPLPAWAVAMQAAQGLVHDLSPAVEVFVSTLKARNAPQPTPGPNAATATARPVSAPPNPMVHLAEINVGLSDFERHFLGDVLRSPRADILIAELLGRSVDEAIAFVKMNIAQARGERAGEEAPAETDDANDSDADSDPVPEGTSTDSSATGFMTRVMAVAALLEPEERAAVLEIIPRLPPERCDQLKRRLLAMTAETAASWIREHLSELRAEVEP